ncbi:hypothetical protein BFP78_15795 [Gaetbulibacter sp. 5U11]|nr:hypothetical protein BFP78_15795 [Gaetbulibacter sp. 5U11]
MPQFYNNLPSTDKAMKEARAEYNRIKNLPIGLIGENNQFAYGWDGDKYYVVEGAFQYLVTKTYLVIDEAKQLFNALSFNNSSEPCQKQITYAIKEARKQKLSGDNLFWFLTDKI